MEDFIQMSYLYDVFLRSTAKLPATSRQPEVTYTSFAKLTLLRYSSGLEPGDSSPVYIRPWTDEQNYGIRHSPGVLCMEPVVYDYFAINGCRWRCVYCDRIC